MVKMSKEKRGSSDVVADMSSKITVVCWKDNKFVNAISIFTGKQSIQQTKRYCHREKWRMNIDKPIYFVPGGGGELIAWIKIYQRI